MVRIFNISYLDYYYVFFRIYYATNSRSDPAIGLRSGPTSFDSGLILNVFSVIVPPKRDAGESFASAIQAILNKRADVVS